MSNHSGPALSLDHIGVIVNDLDVGAQRWRDLGFTLSERSPQMGLNKAGTGFEPWATANHCAVMDVGYLELIGVHRPDCPNPWASFLSRFEGGHIIALRCDTADDAYDYLRMHSEDFDPPVDRRRDAPVDGGTEEMRFRNIFSRDARVREGRYIVIEHQTPQVLWQPRLMRHANGATSIESITVVADQSDDVRHRLGVLCGADASDAAPEHFEFHCPAGGKIVLTSSTQFNARFGTDFDGSPRIAAVSVGCPELASSIEWLQAHNAPIRVSAESAAVGIQSGNGCIVEFVRQSRQL